MHACTNTGASTWERALDPSPVTGGVLFPPVGHQSRDVDRRHGLKDNQMKASPFFAGCPGKLSQDKRGVGERPSI